MFALKIVVTTLIAIICMVIMASAFVAKDGKTRATVGILILGYLLAIFCMWA